MELGPHKKGEKKKMPDIFIETNKDNFKEKFTEIDMTTAIFPCGDF